MEKAMLIPFNLVEWNRKSQCVVRGRVNKGSSYYCVFEEHMLGCSTPDCLLLLQVVCTELQVV